jgi:phosphoglycolate phosphatase
VTELFVLFDVDGTLLLSHDDLYVQANAAALQEVYGLTHVEHPDDPGDTALHYTRIVLEQSGVDEATIDAGLARWCAAISRLYAQLLAGADTSHWVVAPGAAAISEVPHRALLTGNPEPIARARMERMGLAPFFPAGQGAFGCERASRVALIDLALRRAADWPAEAAVAVGDTPRDVESAHEAGLRCIGLTTGAYDRAGLEEADAVIDSLSELPAALHTLD